ncbi:hypothetical protein HanIR_Chr05g0229991 [Helianthus annuus]|nr:hypothetical protein HanIR_Chr05g0229991 [Helianthus annuus]
MYESFLLCIKSISKILSHTYIHTVRVKVVHIAKDSKEEGGKNGWIWSEELKRTSK